MCKKTKKNLGRGALPLGGGGRVQHAYSRSGPDKLLCLVLAFCIRWFMCGNTICLNCCSWMSCPLSGAGSTLKTLLLVMAGHYVPNFIALDTTAGAQRLVMTHHSEGLP